MFPSLRSYFVTFPHLLRPVLLEPVVLPRHRNHLANVKDAAVGGGQHIQLNIHKRTRQFAKSK